MLIKESCNLIWQEAYLAASKQSWLSHMLPFLDDYLNKNIRYYLGFSRDTDDQTILQSGWTRDLSGHTEPKMTFSDAMFSAAMFLKNLRY